MLERMLSFCLNGELTRYGELFRRGELHVIARRLERRPTTQGTVYVTVNLHAAHEVAPPHPKTVTGIYLRLVEGHTANVAKGFP